MDRAHSRHICVMETTGSAVLFLEQPVADPNCRSETAHLANSPVGEQGHGEPGFPNTKVLVPSPTTPVPQPHTPAPQPQDPHRPMSYSRPGPTASKTHTPRTETARPYTPQNLQPQGPTSPPPQAQSYWWLRKHSRPEQEGR